MGLSRTACWGGHSCWELLHDADEGLLGFDCITTLIQHLGAAYARLTSLLRAAMAELPAPAVGA